LEERIAKGQGNTDMRQAPPHFSVESEMNEFISTVGGQVLSTLLGTKNPRFANADYVFRQDNVVAELKCLSENKDADVNQRAQIATLFKRYYDAGKIPYFWGVRAVNSADCPIDLQKQLYRILARPICSHIQKANRQIRETKRALGMHDAHGLLFLANDGNFRLEPAQLLHAVDITLGQRFGAIDTVIIFTVNMSSSPDLQIGGLPPHADVWIPAPRIGHRNVPDEFLNRLSRGWVQHVSAKLKQPIPLFEEVDHAVIEQLRYDNRARPKPIIID
jgi:hypothetical protein